MRATYLTGERIYLRAMTLDDKDHAPAWFDSPFPIDKSRAESFLKDEHKDLSARMRYLMIALTETDAPVGGMHMYTNGRVAYIWFVTAPWLEDADGIKADAMRLVVPWLRDEATMATTDVEIPSDQTQMIAAAEELGMRFAVRLREHITRPGHRVDLLKYQSLGPAWSFPEEMIHE
jgi:RimJ/RimL family protein N-acetyltransferase